MRIKLIILFVGIVICLVLFFIIKPRLFNSTTQVHIHAGFVVYKGNTKTDFSKFEYMHLKPCANDGSYQISSPEDRVHLHDLVGDIVHVHDNNVTWRDLFTNLKYELPSNTVGYVNGELVENPLDTQIKNYDTVLFATSDTTDIDNKIAQLPTKEQIQEIEDLSETCGN